jgi:hypothetical protein
MLRFTFNVEPWDQLKHVKISTLYTYIELKEEEEYVSYEHTEYGQYESIKYKFRLKKRPEYKEYLKDFVSLDIDAVDLRNLMGTMAYFRELYQHAASLLRRGVMADLAFRWHDKDISIQFSLYTSKGEEGVEIQSWLAAEHGGEHISLHHSERTTHIEDTLEAHTKDAVGLYLLFKEYITSDQVGEKA